MSDDEDKGGSMNRPPAPVVKVDLNSNLGRDPGPLPQPPQYISEIGPAFGGMDDEDFVRTLIELLKRRPQWHWTERPKLGQPTTMEFAEYAVKEAPFDAHPQDVARRLTRLIGEKEPGRLHRWTDNRFGDTRPYNQHFWGLPLSELPMPQAMKQSA